MWIRSREALSSHVCVFRPLPPRQGRCLFLTPVECLQHAESGNWSTEIKWLPDQWWQPRKNPRFPALLFWVSTTGSANLSPACPPAPSKHLHTISKQWFQGCWGSGRAISICSAHFPFSSPRAHKLLVPVPKAESVPLAECIPPASPRHPPRLSRVPPSSAQGQGTDTDPSPAGCIIQPVALQTATRIVSAVAWRLVERWTWLRCFLNGVFFLPGMWTSAIHCIDVSDIDGSVWTVITWNLKSLYSCLPFLALGRILHSGMITSSLLISPLCFIAQRVPSDLAAHSPSPPLWNRGRKSALQYTEIPFSSFPLSQQPLHSPCPHHPGYNLLLYLSLPAFPLSFHSAIKVQSSFLSHFLGHLYLNFWLK